MTREDILYIIIKSVEILNKTKGTNFEIVDIKIINEERCNVNV